MTKSCALACAVLAVGCVQGRDVAKTGAAAADAGGEDATVASVDADAPVAAADAGVADEPVDAGPIYDGGRFAWHEVGKNHWQILTAPGERFDATDAAEKTRGRCRPGMVEIKGKMRVTPIGDELQRSICSSWINREFPERCASFDQAKWAKIRDALPAKDMSFCIDRFEYPNRRGEYPLIYVNWNESKSICASDEKRLCTEDEWTFACEGEDALPYPYGYDRDADACLVDKPWRWFDPAAYGGKKEGIVRELDRLWQGVASGSLPKCRSPFGVYDMTGNVDEYTQSLRPTGSPAILKGGYWGPVRTRCRPTTRAHGPEHAFYQQGFRCCTD